MRSRTDKALGVFGLERADAHLAILLGTGLFLLIAVQTTVKAVRDAAFLSHFGIAQLSYLMLGMAVVTTAALGFYNKVTAGRARHRVIWVLNLTVAATFVLLAPALGSGGRVLSVILYAWSGISGLAVISEFWLLANELVTPSQAKRVFAVVASGGLLGGIFGGLVARILAKHLPISALLLVAAGQLALAALLCDRARRRVASAAVGPLPKGVEPSSLLAIFRERAYVRWIFVITVCMTIGTTLVDWQFKAYAKLHFASQENEMVRFFGVVAIALGVLSFLLQLIGSHRLLRFVGANGCMRALPVACGIGAALILATLVLPIPVLFAATCANMLADGVQFSVDRSATELLYTPFTDEDRAVVKRFADTALDRFAGALAAMVWLSLTWFLGIAKDPARLSWVSYVVLGVVAVWLVAVYCLRGGYIDAYRSLLGITTATSPARVMNERERRRFARLLSHLHHDAGKRHHALREMTSLQTTSAELGLTAEQVDPHIVVELDTLELLQRVDEALPTWEPPRLKTLHGMVRERIVQGCERVIRLLAMVYPPRDVTALHHSLRGHSKVQREAALEFLDALVDLPSKARVLDVLRNAMVENPSSKETIERDEALRALLAVDDTLLRGCAAWSAANCGVLLDEVRQMNLTDPSRKVRMIARVVLATRKQRSSQPKAAGPAADNTVERQRAN